MSESILSRHEALQKGREKVSRYHCRLPQRPARGVRASLSGHLRASHSSYASGALVCEFAKKVIYSWSSPTSLSDCIVAMTVGLKYLRAAIRESVAKFRVSTLDLGEFCRNLLLSFQNAWGRAHPRAPPPCQGQESLTLHDQKCVWHAAPGVNSGTEPQPRIIAPSAGCFPTSFMQRCYQTCESDRQLCNDSCLGAV